MEPARVIVGKGLREKFTSLFDHFSRGDHGKCVGGGALGIGGRLVRSLLEPAPVRVVVLLRHRHHHAHGLVVQVVIRGIAWGWTRVECAE